MTKSWDGAFALNHIFECARNTWDPVIRYPTVLGWFIVASYFIATALALLALRAGPDPQPGRSSRYRQFWTLIALALLLLGINRQLDLQSWLTAAGRCAAQLGGWYEERHTAQRAFIFALLAAAGIATLGAAIYFRRLIKVSWLAILGFGFLAAFVAVRAVSAYHFDAAIKSAVAGLRLNGILQLSGIFAIGLNATWLADRKRRGEGVRRRRGDRENRARSET